MGVKKGYFLILLAFLLVGFILSVSSQEPDGPAGYLEARDWQRPTTTLVSPIARGRGVQDRGVAGGSVHREAAEGWLKEAMKAGGSILYYICTLSIFSLIFLSLYLSVSRALVFSVSLSVSLSK